MAKFDMSNRPNPGEGLFDNWPTTLPKAMVSKMKSEGLTGRKALNYTLLKNPTAVSKPKSNANQGPVTGKPKRGGV